MNVLCCKMINLDSSCVSVNNSTVTFKKKLIKRTVLNLILGSHCSPYGTYYIPQYPLLWLYTVE